jgi:hypothetical protein
LQSKYIGELSDVSDVFINRSIVGMSRPEADQKPRTADAGSRERRTIMSQKSGNNVKPPIHNGKGEAPEREQSETISEQHHGESTKAVQEDRRIGQSNGAGRPPLIKK